MKFEGLLREASHHGISTYEKSISPGIKGLYGDGIIWINKNISTSTEKSCVLAEELGHYHTSSGNILDQTKAQNRKQELRARQWAYERLVPLSGIVRAYHDRIKGRHELADYLGVTEEFLQAAIDRYRDKFGLFTVVQDRFIVYFDPLRVGEFFDTDQ